MDHRKPRRAVAVAAALGLAWAASLSGCARDRFYTASPEAGMAAPSRIARRPAAVEPMKSKPMFFGGYAGADYNRASRPAPLRVRPMDVE